MSEFLHQQSERSALLTEYCTRLIKGENGRMLYDAYLPLIETVTAFEAMEVLDILLSEKFPLEEVKENTGKIMNVFYKSLASQPLPLTNENHFIHYLMLENREMEKRMQDIKDLLKLLKANDGADNPQIMESLLQKVEDLQAYDLHYIKKENILFPHIEKSFPAYRCLQLMWSFHDDFRKSVKTILSVISQKPSDMDTLNREMGKLFFVVLPVIFREEKVVFPVALRSLPGEVWHEMLEQCSEVGWCYISGPAVVGQNSSKWSDRVSGLINLDTGLLSANQIIMMLENLPVDITYIDQNDEVRYFSGAKHRIFPRSKSIIGRKVQNCHPPSSVHIVNEIVEAFRSGRREVAEFWIQMKGRFIHIRYFALRDETGAYSGTLEVSQDVTGIRELSGEQRLLTWNTDNHVPPSSQ
jgi:uncharacterized protein